MDPEGYAKGDQTEKDKYYMESLICRIFFFLRQTHRKRVEQELLRPRGWGDREK